MDLKSVRGLMIDMDGVLWRGKEPLPGLVHFFDILRRFDIRFVLATNNSSRRAQQYAEKALGFGLQVGADQIITSGTVTLDYLARRYPPGTRVHVIGERPLHEMVAEAGYVVADDQVEAVVASMDHGMTYETLKRGTFHLRAGAEFIATNPDAAYPSDEGILPGSGTMVAALMASSGRTPTVMGKPEPHLFRLALQRLHLPASWVASLGDRLDTDMAGARAIGLQTILVLSGFTRQEDLATSALEPDLVCQDIAELASLVEAAQGQDVPGVNVEEVAGSRFNDV
jgi:4-nitrophenyl phosphatase